MQKTHTQHKQQLVLNPTVASVPPIKLLREFRICHQIWGYFGASVVHKLSEGRSHCSSESYWIMSLFYFFPRSLIVLILWKELQEVQWCSAFPQHNQICCIPQDNYHLKSFLFSKCNTMRNKVISESFINWWSFNPLESNIKIQIPSVATVTDFMICEII